MSTLQSFLASHSHLFFFTCTISFISVFLSFDYSIEQKLNICNETWNHEYKAGNQTWHCCIRYMRTEANFMQRGNSRPANLNQHFNIVDMCNLVQYRLAGAYTYPLRGHPACCCNCYMSTTTAWQWLPYGKKSSDQNLWNLCLFNSSKGVVRSLSKLMP